MDLTNITTWWDKLPYGVAFTELLPDGSGVVQVNRCNRVMQQELERIPSEERSLDKSGCGSLSQLLASGQFAAYIAGLQNGQNCQLEFQPAAERWLQIDLIPLGLPDLLLLVYDVSPRKKTESELEESRSGYYSLFEQAADGVLVGISDGTIIEANRSVCEMTGYERDELVGMNIAKLFPPQILEAKPLDYDSVQAGATVLNERVLRRKDGRRITIEMNTRKVGDGRLQAYLRDITVRRQMMEELRDSEQKLRTVFENTPLGLCHLDRNGVILNCNSSMGEIMGAPVEQLIGFNTLERIKNPQLIATIQSSLRGEYAYFEGEYISVTGGKRSQLRLHANPVNRGAATTEAIGILEDVTELKDAVDRLQESEKNLRITLDSIGDGVISTDSGGRIVRINRVAAEISGLEPVQDAGKQLELLLQFNEHPSGRRINGVVNQLLTQRRGHARLPQEAVLVGHSGREFRVALFAEPIQDETGESAGAVVVFRDITEQLQLQERLHQAEKMEAIGQLAGGVAHDFNNMLAGIMGGAELLLLQPLDENARGYLEMITGSARRAADLTAKLLAFGRKAKMEYRVIDLHEVINSSLEMLSHSLSKKIAIRTDLSSCHPFVRGDFAQLQNVLINLGLNAGHAMEDGGELEITTRNTVLSESDCAEKFPDMAPGNTVQITVRDNGCGIEAEHLDRIFEPFFTTRAHGKGSGLGLAAVYGTVREHNGVIDVVSQPQVGTVFTLYLPAAEEEPRLEPLQDEIAPGSGTVLLVDDEPLVRRTARGMLEALGYTVREAENGRHAVEQYAAFSDEIDLILLDMLMPEMDGRESFNRFRAINPAARIVLASGYARDDDITRLLEMGAVSFIHKPYSINELGQVLNGALS